MRKSFLVIGSILLLLIGTAHAQSKKVTGKVTDASGLAIPNASVKIKGTNTGTTADENPQNLP
jgi:TonB-dependent starch-binding outer membrane protein SusC